MLLDSNLSRPPFLWQVVNLDLLLCTGTGCFVPMSYFYTETNDWSKDGARWWELLWSATTSRQFHLKFHFTWKKKVTCCGLKFTNHLSQYSKSGRMFSSSKPVEASSDCSRLGNVLCLCLPARPAQAVPVLCHWFCRQNLRLSSGKACRNDCKMTGRGSNLDSNLNSESAAWPTGCRCFICSKVPNSTVWSLNSF